jgi:Fic family protein
LSISSTCRGDLSIDTGFIDMSFDPARPYNDLPPLPPGQDVETKAVLKACVEARAALAELKISGQLIPNPSVLINSIPLLEAQASSEIENIVTTADRLFRFANQPEAGVDPATKEALRYRTALYQGFKNLKSQPLSTRSAIEICRTIKGVDLDIRATPGTALMNEVTGRVVYTPPEGAELLRDKLANWERYIHADDGVDPLIRLAIVHYQFEAIHPFTDGNGRTGRVLNLLFLVEQALLDIPVLYLSRYIIANKKDYYDGLLAVTTDGAWEPWILFMLAAIRETAIWSTAKIRAIRNLLDGTTDRIRRDLPKIYSRELAEIIFVNPYCRIVDLVGAGIAKRQSASVYLKALASLGVLREIEAGREKIYTNPALLTLLSDRSATDGAF